MKNIAESKYTKIISYKMFFFLKKNAYVDLVGELFLV